jgi:hypothetical protein
LGRRIRTSRPSPAIIVAVLALIAALAGTAVAGPNASTSAVSKKKVKKIAKKQAVKQINELAPGLSVANAVNAQNAANADNANSAADANALGGIAPSGFATRLFAYVRVDLPSTYEVEYGRGVTGVTSTGTAGEYDVTFNRNVAGCVAHATPGIGSPRGGDLDANLTTFAGVLVDPDDTPGSQDKVVRAQFYNAGGTPTDTSFLITLFC